MWRLPSQGLLQGCPLSPMLAAVFMHIWAHVVAPSGAAVISFVDDRTFWSSSPQFDEILSRAKELSDRFDRACGFTCRPSKCCIAAPHDRDAMGLADSCGYSLQHVLPVLGVAHDLNNPGKMSFLKFSIAVACARAKCIRLLPLDGMTRR